MKKISIVVLAVLFFSSASVFSAKRPVRSKKEPVKKMSVMQQYEEEESEQTAEFEYEEPIDAVSPSPDPGKRGYKTEEYKGDEEENLPAPLKPKSNAENSEDDYGKYSDYEQEAASVEVKSAAKSSTPKTKKVKIVSVPDSNSKKAARSNGKAKERIQESSSEQDEDLEYSQTSKRALPALMTYSTSAEKVKELLKAGEDPSETDEEGRSVLMYAVYLNGNTDVRVLKLLIEAGADVNASDKKGMTALMFASLKPDENGEFIKILLDAGADVSKKNKKGETALKIALASQDKSKAGDSAAVKLLLKANTRFSSSSSSNSDAAKTTELIKAVTVSFNPAKVKALVDEGADIEEKDAEGNTVLMVASKHSNAEPIKTLIALGANVNAKNDAGQTPLMIACANGYNPEKIKALIAAKADVFDKDDDGRTALMIAAKNNPEPLVVRMLLDAYSDPNDQDFDGRTPLMYAAFNSYRKAEILSLLIKAGAYVDLTDNGGNTALHYAAMHNQYDYRSPALIAILLEEEININAKNGKGKTALDTAKENNNLQAAKFLTGKMGKK
ncbi:MAG: ankyrin repeat domain-containing protein [Endomicrobium sp.]|jgi:ankyrin repeat protein|nr:ankyrin repeat domain-containing protein [Endomicrobium sp.]